MATVKIVLRRKQNKDGTYPLALRVIKDRRSAFIHLGYSVFEKDWDAAAQRVKRSHPNSARLNSLIVNKLADSTNTLLELDTQRKDVSSDGIKRRLKPRADTMFFARAELFLQRLRDEGRYNTWATRVSHIRVFKEFLLGTEAILGELSPQGKTNRPITCRGLFSGADVPFQRIDVELLTQFKIYLKAQRGGGDFTVANYLTTLQSIFTQSVRDGVVDQKFSPFGRDKIRVKIPESQKLGLTAAEVAVLEALTLPKPAHREALDLWLVSFYFAGMRVGDVLQLRWRDLRDGRLHYVMGKNHKPVSLKIPQKAQAVLERYAPFRKGPDDFVFSYLRGLEHVEDPFVVKKRIKQMVRTCDSLLNGRIASAAGITAKLTMHIARHTFATLAGDKIPIQMLQKLYRHSDIKTTLGYQSNFIHRDADEALNAVLGG